MFLRWNFAANALKLCRAHANLSDEYPMMKWVSLFRPGDWVKNIFVLLPMVFWLSSQGRDTPTDVVTQKWGVLVLAFIAFCVTASGTYAMNDALDASEDRKHP